MNIQRIPRNAASLPPEAAGKHAHVKSTVRELSAPMHSPGSFQATQKNQRSARGCGRVPLDMLRGRPVTDAPCAEWRSKVRKTDAVLNSG